jgi:hypothetical protein
MNAILTTLTSGGRKHYACHPDPSLSHFLQCTPGNSQTRFSGRWYKGSHHWPWRLSRCKKLRQKRCSAVMGFNEAT